MAQPLPLAPVETLIAPVSPSTVEELDRTQAMTESERWVKVREYVKVRLGEGGEGSFSPRGKTRRA